MEKRPDFETLVSYEEFKKYYWYRKELSGICRKLGIEYRGTKQELNHHIEEYFCGKLAERKDVPRLSKKVSDIELHTPLLDCGFSFNAFFREYFAKQTGTRPFKFTADMAAAWRKVKKTDCLPCRICWMYTGGNRTMQSMTHRFVSGTDL